MLNSEETVSGLKDLLVLSSNYSHGEDVYCRGKVFFLRFTDFLIFLLPNSLSFRSYTVSILYDCSFIYLILWMLLLRVVSRSTKLSRLSFEFEFNDFTYRYIYTVIQFELITKYNAGVVQRVPKAGACHCCVRLVWWISGHGSWTKGSFCYWLLLTYETPKFRSFSIHHPYSLVAGEFN